MNQNNQQVQGDMQSVLSNQARIMTHLMSLDECDINVPGGNTNLQGQALTAASNPRSPQSQQKFDSQRGNNGGLLLAQMSQ